MNSIFIEGVCGTGKTTLVNGLAKSLPALTIPELPEYNRGLLQPFTSPLNIKKNFKDYVIHEVLRESILYKKFPNEIQYGVIDRSYISIIALSLSMLDIIGIQFSKTIMNLIIDKIFNEELYTPDKIIILSADYKSINFRNNQKNKELNSLWTDKDRIIPQENFYNFLSTHAVAQKISSQGSIQLTLSTCLKICKEQTQYEREKIIDVISQYAKKL